MKKSLLVFSFFIFLLLPIFVLATDRIDINIASLKELELLSGIGPVKAQAIIDARPFSSVDDLLRVKGIGPITLQKIKDQGLAYVEGQTQQSTQEVNQSQEQITENSSQLSAELADKEESKPKQTEPTTEIEEKPTGLGDLSTYPDGIVFNEVLASPEGPDEENEWIEIYNQNDFEVNLTNWQIQDKEGNTSSFVFPNMTIIKPKGYLVFSRPTTKITLNNTGDQLTLLNPNKEIVDTITYKKSPTGKSYNRTNNGWQWSSSLTPGLTNVVKETIEKTKDNNNETKENLLNNELITAALNKGVNQSKSFFLIFLTAFAFAGISTTLFFSLKTKLNNKKDKEL